MPASVPGPRIGPEGGTGTAPAAAPFGREFRPAAAAEQPLHHDPRRHVDAPVAAAAAAVATGVLQWSVDAATAATDVLAATCAAAAPVQQAVTCMVIGAGEALLLLLAGGCARAGTRCRMRSATAAAAAAGGGCRGLGEPQPNPSSNSRGCCATHGHSAIALWPPPHHNRHVRANCIDSSRHPSIDWHLFVA